MVIPLRKNTMEDEPYKRRSVVEDMLLTFDGLAPQKLVHLLSSTQSEVPFEVLIYYLRHVEFELEDKYLEAIFNAFYSRLKLALSKSVPSTFDNATHIREEIVSRILEMIAKDRESQNDQMYYWEVNFNQALASLRNDVLRQMGPAKSNTDPLVNYEPLTHEGEDGLEIQPEIDIAASDFFNTNPSILDDTDFRLRLFDAINGLPKEERRAIGLFLQGMQVESKDPEIMTISKALACTDRTVRNRLNRAYKKLQSVLQVEENVS